MNLRMSPSRLKFLSVLFVALGMLAIPVGLVVAVQANVATGWGALGGGLVAVPLLLRGMAFQKRRAEAEKKPDTLLESNTAERGYPMWEETELFLFGLVALFAGLYGTITGHGFLFLIGAGGNPNIPFAHAEGVGGHIFGLGSLGVAFAALARWATGSYGTWPRRLGIGGACLAFLGLVISWIF